MLKLAGPYILLQRTRPSVVRKLDGILGAESQVPRSFLREFQLRPSLLSISAQGSGSAVSDGGSR